MTQRLRQERCIIAGLLACGAVVFLLGINWGLPSRQIDRYLFGSAGEAWSGERIVAAGGAYNPDPSRPADAASSPITDRSHAIWINETAGQKAQILNRYRLYSHQPDEMVTFRALAQMRGGSLDPRMYQYGGAWIYPVGALLKIGSILGLVELKPDFQTYLDHPEAFGRFYIVARFYSALWGVAGIWAIFRLARRFSDHLILPATAAACFIFMPVIVNGVHEAKPHLAGAVLVLLSVLAAVRFAETGERKWWSITGLCCGLAAAMVLTSAVAVVVIPLMTLLRPMTWSQRIKISSAAGAIALATYCLTNPYVPINLLRDPAVLRKNLFALTQVKALAGKANDISALPNARMLIIEGGSIIAGVTGLIGLLIMIVNRTWWQNRRWRNVVVLLGAPAAIVLAIFTLKAGGKTGEFGRFFILPDIALMLVAIVLVNSLGEGKRWIIPLLVLLIAVTACQGLGYLAGFMEDTHRATSSRLAAAEEINKAWQRGARTVGVLSDPAPYCLPPLDFTRWKVILLPENWRAVDPGGPDLVVGPVDEIRSGINFDRTPYERQVTLGHWPWLKTRISWADKPIEILVRREMIQHRLP